MVEVESETVASTPIPNTGVWYSGALSMTLKCFDVLVAGKCDSTNQSRSFELVGPEDIPDFFTKNSTGSIVFAEPQAISIKMPRGCMGDVVVRLKAVSTEQADFKDYVCLGIKINGEFVDKLYDNKKYKINNMTDLMSVELVPLISKTPLSTQGYTEVAVGTEVSKSGIPISGTSFNFGTVYRITVGDEVVWSKNLLLKEGNSLYDVSDIATWWNEGQGIGIGPVRGKDKRLLAINYTTGKLASSIDGESWEDEGSVLEEGENLSKWMAGPVYNGSNTWCVLSEDGAAKYSNDGGVSWVKSKTPPAGTETLTFANGMFMTVANNRNVYISYDADIWSLIGSVPYSNKEGVRILKYNSNKNEWMCVTSLGSVYTSKDGKGSWTLISNLGSICSSWIGACCYGNGYCYAIDGNYGIVAKSADGVTWTKVADLSGGKIPNLGEGYFNITFYNGKLYAFKGNGLKYAIGSFD